jgi:hypothetical protein
MAINFPFYSVNVSQFMSAKPESKWATRVGNFIAWNTEFSLMAKCQAIKLSVVEMTPLIPSSVKLALENMFLELCLLI